MRTKTAHDTQAHEARQAGQTYRCRNPGFLHLNSGFPWNPADQTDGLDKRTGSPKGNLGQESLWIPERPLDKGSVSLWDTAVRVPLEPCAGDWTEVQYSFGILEPPPPQRWYIVAVGCCEPSGFTWVPMRFSKPLQGKGLAAQSRPPRRPPIPQCVYICPSHIFFGLSWPKGWRSPYISRCLHTKRKIFPFSTGWFPKRKIFPFWPRTLYSRTFPEFSTSGLPLCPFPVWHRYFALSRLS